MDKGETKKYSQTKTEELIENYKDLIDKTFEVTDKDLLQKRLDEESEEESEEKYLNAIKKRRVALDEVDLMLDKIEKLETRLYGDSIAEGNPAKDYRKK